MINRLGPVADAEAVERGRTLNAGYAVKRLSAFFLPSNVIAVSKRTQPNRSMGVGHLAAGLFLDVGALWLAMKTNEFPEGSRGDVYKISGGMVLASVPLLALGTYMLTKPAQTTLLW